ncbi:MAG: YqiA/YcfP family alpha/beta fold hydrolase, partial [Anaerolineae bacterium]
MNESRGNEPRSTALSAEQGAAGTAGPTHRTILYLHGFLSSAQSTKARFLRKRLEPLPDVTFHAIDFN